MCGITEDHNPYSICLSETICRRLIECLNAGQAKHVKYNQAGNYSIIIANTTIGCTAVLVVAWLTNPQPETASDMFEQFGQVSRAPGAAHGLGCAYPWYPHGPHLFSQDAFLTSRLPEPKHVDTQPGRQLTLLSRTLQMPCYCSLSFAICRCTLLHARDLLQQVPS